MTAQILPLTNAYQVALLGPGNISLIAGTSCIITTGTTTPAATERGRRLSVNPGADADYTHEGPEAVYARLDTVRSGVSAVLAAIPRFTLNHERNAVAAFGSVPASYGTLLAADGDRTALTLMLYNATDADITVRLEGLPGVTIPVPAGLAFTQENYPHWGTVEYKYDSVAPTSGYFLAKSW